MQIKRFEAADMTEALRLVKREFGDDAVILSAKEVRPRGFFSALRKKHVEIRAAIDDSVPEENQDDAFSGLLAKQLDALSTSDRVSLSSAPASGKAVPEDRPTVLTTAPASGEPFNRSKMNATPPSLQSMADVIPRTYGRATVADGNPSAKNPMAQDELARGDDRDRLVVEPFYHDSTNRKIIALVGPPGSGKSAAAAKIAWQCQVNEGKRVGMVSLDRFNVAANSVLKRVAVIMNLSLTEVHDAEEMQAVLNRLMDVDVVLIDTPGLGRPQRAKMEAVGSLLRIAAPDEVHLVANATVRDDVLAATVDTFAILGVNRLLLTHWDENGNGSIMDQLKKWRLPASFYSDGIDLCENLKTMTTQGISLDRCDGRQAVGRITAFPRREQGRSVRMDDPIDRSSYRYLANRNSELFHRPSCKSVKRINTENIAAFDSIEQAIEEGFRPCRACCDISMIRRTAPADNWKQRARAI